MQKFLVVAVVIALGASVVLGVVSINHLSLIEELEEEKAGLESDVSDLQSEMQDQQSAIEDLEARPAVNPRELVQLLSDLRVDVDGLASDVDGFATDLSGITSIGRAALGRDLPASRSHHPPDLDCSEVSASGFRSVGDVTAG